MNHCKCLAKQQYLAVGCTQWYKLHSSVNAWCVHVADLAASDAFLVTGNLAGGSPGGVALLAEGSSEVGNPLAEGPEGIPASQPCVTR